MKWFRWHRGTCEDSKFRSITRESRVTLCDVIAAWAFILEDASHPEHRGILCNQHLMDALFDWKPGVAQNIIRSMAEHGLLQPCQDPAWIWGHTVTHWKARQYEGDTDSTASERQRRKRERDRVTRESRSVTRDSVTESRPDSDTESESENKKKYRFAGKTIRLTESDYEQWRRSYPDLDLAAQLQSLDDWITSEGEVARGKWFSRVSGALKNRQEAARAKKKPQVSGRLPEFKPEKPWTPPTQEEREANNRKWMEARKKLTGGTRNEVVRRDDEIEEGSPGPAATKGSGVRNLLPALQAVDDTEENQAEASNQAVPDAVLVCRDAPG